MEDLVFRPLFLRVSRGARLPFTGKAVFFSSSGSALSSLAALHLFLAGHGSSLELLPGAEGVSGSNLVFELRPRRSSTAPEWEGGGELASGGEVFSFSLGTTDRLSLKAGGVEPIRLVLPEGAGRYYSALDSRECAAEGRASRILPPEARLRVEAFLREARA